MRQLKDYINESCDEIKYKYGEFYCDHGSITFYDEVTVYPVYRPNCIEIGVLQTDEGFRGKGIATKLMNKMIEYAKSHKQSIVLIASPLNKENTEDELINFYKKFGFVEDKKAHDKKCLIYEV